MSGQTLHPPRPGPVSGPGTPKAAQIPGKYRSDCDRRAAGRDSVSSAGRSGKASVRWPLPLRNRQCWGYQAIPPTRSPWLRRDLLEHGPATPQRSPLPRLPRKRRGHSAGRPEFALIDRFPPFAAGRRPGRGLLFPCPLARPSSAEAPHGRHLPLPRRHESAVP